MKLKNVVTILAGVASLALTTPADACTGIRVTAKDGSVIFGQTGEFGAELNARFIIIPKALKMDGGAIDGAKPKTWVSKFGVVGVNAHGAPTTLDGMNEAGLSVGAFYFPDYASYPKVSSADDGAVVNPVNLVNYLLTQYATVKEVRQALDEIKVSGASLPEWGGIVPPFHWIATDRSGASIVIEPVDGKLVVHDNPLGIISNSPTFDWHMTNLRNFIHLNPLNVPPVKLDKIELRQLGQGSGLAGMPGDFTPPSRFVRAAVYTQSLFPVKRGKDAVLEAFHILNQFDIPRGAAVGMHEGKPEADITQATVVANLKDLKYYAHNYQSRRIKMIDLRKVNFKADKIVQVDLPSEETIDDLTPKQ